MKQIKPDTIFHSGCLVGVLPLEFAGDSSGELKVYVILTRCGSWGQWPVDSGSHRLKCRPRLHHPRGRPGWCHILTRIRGSVSRRDRRMMNGRSATSVWSAKLDKEELQCRSTKKAPFAFNMRRSVPAFRYCS